MTALHNINGIPGIYLDSPYSVQSSLLIPDRNPTPIHQNYQEEINRRSKEEDLWMLENLKDWPENWDGMNAAKPETKAIVQAGIFLNDLFLLKLNLQEQWVSPNITASSEGEVVLEWWNKQKKVTIYISSSSMTYIKVPSACIQEMEDGALHSLNPEFYINLFSWLDE